MKFLFSASSPKFHKNLFLDEFLSQNDVESSSLTSTKFIDEAASDEEANYMSEDERGECDYELEKRSKKFKLKHLSLPLIGNLKTNRKERINIKKNI